MSKFKHTPGPWVIAPPFEEDGLVEIPIGVMTPMGLFTVAVVIGGMSPEMQVANAGLVVAAPDTAAERDRLRELNAELLEALQDAIELIETISLFEGQTVRKARAAIAKAKGETE